MKFIHSFHKQFLSTCEVPGAGPGAKPETCAPCCHSTYGAVGKYKGHWTSQEQKLCASTSHLCIANLVNCTTASFVSFLSSRCHLGIWEACHSAQFKTHHPETCELLPRKWFLQSVLSAHLLPPSLTFSDLGFSFPIMSRLKGFLAQSTFGLGNTAQDTCTCMTTKC